MKVRPYTPPNYVFLDCANSEGDRPSVPIGALSEEEYQQFAEDTAALMREHYLRKRASLLQKEK